MCGFGPYVDTYGATLNVHDFVQCYAIEWSLGMPRVCRIYRRFTLLLLGPPQTTVFGATLNAKLRGHTLNAQWQLFLATPLHLILTTQTFPATNPRPAAAFVKRGGCKGGEVRSGSNAL